MQDEKAEATPEAEAALIQLDGEQDAVAVTDPELGVRSSRVVTPSSTNTDTELEPVPKSNGTASLTSRIFGSGRTSPTQTELSPKLARLVESYASSEVAKEARQGIRDARSHAHANGHADGQAVVLRSYKRAGWWSQFMILSGRSFKNLYRNPMLMLSHYAVAVIVACQSSRPCRPGSLADPPSRHRYLRLPLPRIDVSLDQGPM